MLSIVFEDAFDNKLFSQQYKGKSEIETCQLTAQPNPCAKPLHTHSPLLLPALP